MATRTTMTKANAFKRISSNRRSATSGNKNISMRASRKTAESQKSRIASVFSKTHTGPYLGSKSV